MSESNSIAEIKMSKDYKLFQNSLKSLINLANNKRLCSEVELLQKMSPKISIRLRNSPFSRSLEQLLALNIKTITLMKSPIFEQMETLFDSNTSKNTCKDLNDQQTKSYIETLETLARYLFKIVCLSKKSFELAQFWLDLGQLINHFLIISCLSSRICVFSKAQLVYLYDVYQIVWRIRNNIHGHNLEDQVKPLLHKLNIKTRPVKETKAKKKEILNDSNDYVKSMKSKIEDIILKEETFDIGVPIDRKLFNRNVKQIHSKKKNKKKLAHKRQ